MGAQFGWKCRPLCLGRLPRLILRPAVKGGLAEFGVGPLLFLRDRVQSVTPLVVILNRRLQGSVVVAIDMRGHAARLPQADMALTLRSALAQARDRNDQIRQLENARDLVDLVSYDADRANAEPNGFRAQDHGLHGKRGIYARV